MSQPLLRKSNSIDVSKVYGVKFSATFANRKGIVLLPVVHVLEPEQAIRNVKV